MSSSPLDREMLNREQDTFRQPTVGATVLLPMNQGLFSDRAPADSTIKHSPALRSLRHD